MTDESALSLNYISTKISVLIYFVIKQKQINLQIICICHQNIIENNVFCLFKFNKVEVYHVKQILTPNIIIICYICIQNNHYYEKLLFQLCMSSRRTV
jgi:hypothetical protein